MTETLRIALLGAGQLGGSFVLALRENGADIRVAAYDPSPTHAEELKTRGGVDVVCATPEDAAKGADMVLLAAPLRTYRALVSAIAPVLDDGCILTDLGSVKGGMVALAPLAPKAHVIPAHPIAGSEKSGPEAARGDLFKGKLCILTPGSDTDEQAFRAVEALWDMVGADVIAMPHELHDQIYAHVSHLPHYIAFLAAGYFYDLGVRITTEDATLQQFLRISRSNPRMWTDVALENRAALLPILGTYIALLEHFAGELRAGDKHADTANPDKPHLAKTLLPRVLAASLISNVSLYEQASGQSLRAFAGAGMRDVVAPAAVTPEADTEAMSNHSTAMAGIIEGIIPHFRALETMLGAEDEAALYASVSQMVEDAHLLVTPRN
jgi:prephenate dehydrogenase